jgi:hypothetical protein
MYFSLQPLLFEKDFLVLPFYISGSVLGKWIAMTKMDNIEFKIFSFFSNKTQKIKNK